ncbi:MAG: hypothetical protein ACXIU7_10700 [Roseinatronobacter sp.]
MGHLTKLNFKEFTRNVQSDPVLVRRDKLLAAIAEQQKVLAAALNGAAYTVAVKRTRQVDGEKVQVNAERTIRAWFFEQDGGWFVQCKYGARPLRLSENGNAVFVPKLDAVSAVLEAFKLAAMSGELDAALAKVAKRK